MLLCLMNSEWNDVIMLICLELFLFGQRKSFIFEQVYNLFSWSHPLLSSIVMRRCVQLLQWLTFGIYIQAFFDGTELYNWGGFLQFVVKTVLKSRKLNLCEHTFDCNFQSDHQLMNWNYTVTKNLVLDSIFFLSHFHFLQWNVYFCIYSFKYLNVNENIRLFLFIIDSKGWNGVKCFIQSELKIMN